MILCPRYDSIICPSIPTILNVFLRQGALTNKKPAIKAGFFYWRFRDESSARFSNVMIDGCVEL
jgi:hypothetical protein